MKKRKIKKENENSFINIFLARFTFIAALFYIFAAIYSWYEAMASAANVEGTILFEIAEYISCQTTTLSIEKDQELQIMLLVLIPMLLFLGTKIFLFLSKGSRKRQEQLRKDKNVNLDGPWRYYLGIIFLFLEALVSLVLLVMLIFLFIAVMIFPKNIAQDVILFINVFVATGASFYAIFKKISDTDFMESLDNN